MELKFVNRLYFWAHYKYAGRPMCFVKLLDDGEKLPADTVGKILFLFDEWYGNTEQRTTDWALEYQLLTRMLLSDGALLVNFRYLDLSGLDFEDGTCVPSELAAILKSVSLKALHAYSMAHALTQEEINQLYIEEEELDLSEMKYRRVMITRCGYAVVPGDTDQEALENAKDLRADDFDWERVDSNLIEGTCEVVEVCNEDEGI